MRWTSRNPAETRALAEGLAQSLASAGGVVGLIGPLGAGKTVFAKGLAAGLGIDPGVLSSPTFVIAGEFPLGAGADIDRLVHADFYRVEDGLELEMAGLADWLAPGTVLLAEWADRFPQELPNDRIEVQLEPSATEAAEERSLEARALGGPGSVSQQVLGRWRERCP